jgi:hypothetical protein
MTLNADIARLLDQFAALCPEAVVEGGPLLPDTRPELRWLLDEWLRHYPQLRADPGYVAFLEACSSACAFAGERNIRLEIVGVLNFEEHVSMHGFAEFADGWYCLGWSSVYHGAIGDSTRETTHGYYFDLWGRGAWGIYHDSFAPSSAPTERKLVADTFMECLEWIIRCKGNPD